MSGTMWRRTWHAEEVSRRIQQIQKVKQKTKQKVSLLQNKLTYYNERTSKADIH